MLVGYEDLQFTLAYYLHDKDVILQQYIRVVMSNFCKNFLVPLPQGRILRKDVMCKVRKERTWSFNAGKWLGK